MLLRVAPTACPHKAGFNASYPVKIAGELEDRTAVMPSLLPWGNTDGIPAKKNLTPYRFSLY
jgi:hypothetical protein